MDNDKKIPEAPPANESAESKALWYMGWNERERMQIVAASRNFKMPSWNLGAWLAYHLNPTLKRRP
jgi:hypothetical protein